MHVSSLSRFYRCSDELASCIPPPLPRPRNTRQVARSLARRLVGAVTASSHLPPDCGTLPPSVFPNSHDLLSF
ncbi:hypothetical protein SK128_026231 [Halocaridina rubra]|uniref:Uncharacterized protein n=1 Tax=Halocaridina rubra TaxID=373956 RepID=A0AAN8WZX0_HALRR